MNALATANCNVLALQWRKYLLRATTTLSVSHLAGLSYSY